MKITLSKSQWQEMGKKAGWDKVAQGRMDKNHENPELIEENRVRNENADHYKKIITTRIMRDLREDFNLGRIDKDALLQIKQQIDEMMRGEEDLQ